MNFEEPKDDSERPPEDRWLDEALAHYSAAEPRPGLENRVLANLEADAAQRQRRWFYAFAAAAAVLLVAVLATTLRTGKQGNPSNVAENKPALVHVAPAVSTQNVATDSARPPVPLVRRNQVRAQAKVANRVVVLQAADAKQEHFPADQPLSEQERLLQLYLKQTPQQELQLIAGRQQSAAGIDIPELEVQPIEIDKSTAQ